MDMFSINKHALEFQIFTLFAVALILYTIFCIWNILKNCWMLEDRQNDWQSRNEEGVEMGNLVPVHYLENALHENESADAPEI